MVYTRTPVAGFTTREELAAVVAGIPRTVDPWRGEEGPRWRVTFSPGAVQLGTRDLGKLEAAQARAIAKRLRDTELMTLEAPAITPRGKVTAWSRKSVANMARTLAQLDYSTFLGGDATPAMFTGTLPGDWQTVAGTPAKFRAIVNRFRARYERDWGHAMPGIWKLEFQRRGAPHIHVLTSVPAGVVLRPWSDTERAHGSRCRRLECDHSAHVRPLLEFREWAAEAWALAVGHPDPEQFEANRKAGTQVLVDLELRYGDARRVAVYFSKHGMLSAKAYQNEPPAEWVRAIEDEGEAGARFWGYWVVRPLREVLETDASLIIHIARHLRKLERSRSHSRPVTVWRVDQSTGVARRRKVRRRVQYMTSTRGFLTVNDGAQVAAGIARIVDAYLAGSDWFSFGGVPTHSDRSRMVPASGRDAWHAHAHTQSGERVAA